MTGILLDTSFLLPIVGIRVARIDGILRNLRSKHEKGEVTLYYTDLNLLEIAWVLKKTGYETLIVEEGLRSIERNFKKVALKAPSILRALELREKGFKDLIDLLLYILALENGLRFLTLDRNLIEFIKRIGGDTRVFLTNV